MSGVVRTVATVAALCGVPPATLGVALQDLVSSLLVALPPPTSAELANLELCATLAAPVDGVPDFARWAAMAPAGVLLLLRQWLLLHTAAPRALAHTGTMACWSDVVVAIASAVAAAHQRGLPPVGGGESGAALQAELLECPPAVVALLVDSHCARAD